MNKDVIEQAQEEIAEARRMIDTCLEQYSIGLRWLQQDLKRADGFMVWRESGLYTQANLSQWAPRKDLFSQCELVVDAAERILRSIMDKEDKGAEDARYWAMLASEEHTKLKEKMMAAWENIRMVNIEYGALRRQYGLPDGLTDDT